ncbi:sulfotransferase [Oceanicola sp. D3]|uniref:sulfotransferase domain-containing protein n=1 Tax=Oceanicola sp. D3 TaxID=2587163 RepID=UPI00111D5862|nr:sulfotransferase domain-containing protein [Oceanicola sp. D3]QDC09202.1 sulfotransferase [Oceanicola sp. D3]
MTQPRILCFGSHHKTGTIWMRGVSKAIRDDQNIPFLLCYRAERLADIVPEGPQIIVNWNSSFPQELFDMEEARFLHIIRDPRDVLLSGMRYHRIAPLAREKFLRIPRPKWGGMNYQDKLNSLDNDHERLIFEMENRHHRTLQEMLDWPYDHPNVVDLRYEDLISDEDCVIFRAAMERMGVAGIDVDRAVKSFWDKSLFGGLKKEEDRTDRVALHVTSGTGSKKQWQNALPRSIAKIYAERYSDALAKLGYAEDDSWVDLCPEDEALAEAQEDVGAK